MVGEDILTTKEAAEMLGVSRPTIREWVDDGTLRGFQLNPDKAGSPYRVYLSSVKELIEKRKRQLGQTT